MKFKILLTIIFGIIITTIIYFTTKPNKINFLALGDGLSSGMTAYSINGYNFNDYLVNDYSTNNLLNKNYQGFNEVDETVTNLITKINNNVENKNSLKLKQAIKNADIITIALGMDELNTYASKKILASSKINGYLKKMEELLTSICYLNDKKIYLIGLYKTNLINQSKIDNINKELEKLANSKNIIYIDISNISNNSEYFANKNSYYLNYKGHKYIYELIKNNTRETFNYI